MADVTPIDTPQLVNDLYNLLCKHKQSLKASELSDAETAYLTVIEKTLSEMNGLELFWSPLLENEEGDVVEPYTEEA
jgi:hypothetical protein